MSNWPFEVRVPVHEMWSDLRSRLRDKSLSGKLVLGILLIAVIIFTVVECSFDTPLKISRFHSRKVWVACDFRSGNVAPFVRGQSIWIDRHPISSGEEGAYRIMGVDGGRVRENYFVEWNPDSNFKIRELTCTEHKFDLSSYDLTGVCQGDFPKQDGQASFFVLAQGTKRSSQKPRIQVRCSDGTFDDFEDREAENSAVAKPPGPGAAIHRKEKIQRKSGRKLPQEVRAPRPGCGQSGRCERGRGTSFSPPPPPARGWVGPR